MTSEGKQCYQCGHWNTIQMKPADFLDGLVIPMYVCSQCDAVWFDQPQANLIDKIRCLKRDNTSLESRLAEAERREENLKTRVLHQDEDIQNFLARAEAAESRLRESGVRGIDVDYLEQQIAFLLEEALVEEKIAADLFVIDNRKQLRFLIEKAVSSLPTLESRLAESENEKAVLVEATSKTQPAVRNICDILIGVTQEGGWNAWRERDRENADRIWGIWTKAHNTIKEIDALSLSSLPSRAAKVQAVLDAARKQEGWLGTHSCSPKYINEKWQCDCELCKAVRELDAP